MADYEDVKVTDLVINNISQEKYDELKTAGQLEATQIYLTPTEESGGSGLPDQTDNAGKFLTTDGTTASWGKALVNRGAERFALIIGDSTMDTSKWYNVLLGYNARSYAVGNIKIGTEGLDRGTYNVGLGHSISTEPGIYGTINLGYGSKPTESQTLNVRFAGGGGHTGSTETYTLLTADGNVPRERLKNLVEVLPTEDNGYTTVKNFGNGYVEITGYASIGTVGAGTGSEVQIDLPAGYTMADTNYWVNIAPTSETTMFDFKAEAKARSTTHFMVAYKNEDDATGLTAAGVYWEVRGMLATA